MVKSSACHDLLNLHFLLQNFLYTTVLPKSGVGRRISIRSNQSKSLAQGNERCRRTFPIPLALSRACVEFMGILTPAFAIRTYRRYFEFSLVICNRRSPWPRSGVAAASPGQTGRLFLQGACGTIGQLRRNSRSRNTSIVDHGGDRVPLCGGTSSFHSCRPVVLRVSRMSICRRSGHSDPVTDAGRVSWPATCRISC